MACTRTCVTSLLVASLLLVSLLTPHLPVASARHVAVLRPNNGVSNNRGDQGMAAKELASAASTDDLSTKKGFSGRKLGPRNEEETGAMGATTAAASLAGSRPRTVEMRTAAAAARHGDAAAEVYEMLKRDYAYKASRRRPINNGAGPLQQKKP